MHHSKKAVFGLGSYSAVWIDDGPMVRLTATGILPCSNYFAQLEKRPERVSPPLWNMVFFIDDTCEKRLTPFSNEVLMLNESGAAALIVHDALGVQEVPILPTPETADEEGENFVVYARLPRPEKGHHGCSVVSEDAIMTADRYRAFGPATRDECEDFVTKNCGAKSDLILAGGEIPWPLLA